MRLTIFLLTAAFIHVQATAVSQNVTIAGRDFTLKQIFTSIEKQTGYVVFSNKQLLTSTKTVSLSVTNMPLKELLDVVLKDLPLEYIIQDKTIFLSEKGKGSRPIADNSIMALVPVPVRVKVVDSVGRPLSGATVSLKNRILGVTGAEGVFNVNVTEGDVLTVTFIGYEPRQLIVTSSILSSSNNLVITLKPSIANLEEIDVTVNTGYQNIPKERATGSFVKIDNSLLNRTVSTNLPDRLLYVTNSLKGEPGIATNISIRGLSTINANMVPLVVIDGFPYEEGTGKGSAAIALNSINPNDIESITILRDAAAASIWGARSGNGVIVITTKRGAFNKKMSVQFNGSINITGKQDLDKINIISPGEAIEFQKKLFNSGYYNAYNGPFSASYSYPIVSPAVEIMLAQKRNEITQQEAESQLEFLALHDVRDDISKYILQQSINQQYSVNISGGSGKSNYYGSVGYDDNRGALKRDRDSRFTLRFENAFKPVKNIDINMFIAYSQSNIQNNGLDYKRYIADGNKQAAPYTLLADAAGTPLHTPVSGTLRLKYIDTIKTPGLLDWHYRPLDEITSKDDRIRQINARFGGSVRYMIFPCLTAEVKGQYEKMIGSDMTYNSLKTYFTRDLINRFVAVDATGKVQYPVPLGGILDYTIRSRQAWNIRMQLNLNKSWVSHSVVAIAGYETRESEFESNKGRKYGYDPATFLYTSTMDYKNVYPRRPSGSARIADGNGMVGTLNRFVNYFGNAAYTFRNKYTYTMSGRIDASNYFGVLSNQRYIPLWSSGVSWNISRENFWHVAAIPYLKVRATYGFNGNLNNTATSLPTVQYNIGSNIYNNANYASLITPPNPGLTWEKVRMINLGVDFGLLNNKLTGTIEYYTKKGINLIGSIVSEPTTGFFQYTGNYAGMKGKGLDIILNAKVINQRLKWDVAFNFSYNIDKVTSYELSESTLKRAINYLSDGLPVIGQPLYKLYSYKWAGLDPATGSPRGFVANTIVPFETVIQGNNTLPEDLVYEGNTRAPYFGSMLNTFYFNRFSFSGNITYRFGHKFRRESINYNNLISNWGGHSDYSLRWRKPGDELITNVPSLPATPNDYYSFYGLSEVLVERGDIIRLQDIRIGYDFFPRLNKTVPLKMMQIYVYVNNLAMIWKANRANIDPDFSITPARSFAIGIRADL